VEQGADIHAKDDEALRCSAENRRLEVVKYLVEQGANIHDNDDFALLMMIMH
jgi:ankyrin repeat protein